jgi:hypothetical protein
MFIKNSKQIWEGFFTYNEGYDISDQNIEVAFKMELIFNKDSFIGFSTDSESENIFKKPSSVKGFIEDEKISFVINYPCFYYKDETGNIFLDKKNKHPEIYYLGFWDNDKKCYSGTWTMTVDEEKYFDDYIEEILNGEFEIRRIK